MSLLEEGIATGNVLPTGRKEKHSIDNVTRDFDIYRIKCDLLFYNDQNDRIATWVSEYNSAQGADLLALGRDEYNGVIEDFIVESNPGALRKTEKSIALRGQLRPGIVAQRRTRHRRQPTPDLRPPPRAGEQRGGLVRGRHPRRRHRQRPQAHQAARARHPNRRRGEGGVRSRRPPRRRIPRRG